MASIGFSAARIHIQHEGAFLAVPTPTLQVDDINALEPKMQKLSDEELRAKTEEFKARIESGESLDSLLVEAFAVCFTDMKLCLTCPWLLP